jgi:predicted dehydrogenase
MGTRTPVNVGIVGLGFMAATHLNAYQKIKGARIRAICNPSGRRLDGIFKKVGGNIGPRNAPRLNMKEVKAYDNFAELLADPEIHLIDICAPTHAHPTLAIAAIQAGKHVVCEKPLARTAELARQIVGAAAQSKGFFMPAMCLRFWPGWAWLKELVDNKTYGKALSARFTRAGEAPAWGQKHFHDGKQSGGALLDLHIHDTDFVQFLFGRPISVFSSGYTKISGAIDHLVTQYQVVSGATVSAEGSWAMARGYGFNMSYTLNFEEATVDYDLSRGAAALRVFRKGRAARTIAIKGDDGYVNELRYMLEAIRTGKPPTVVTARDGLSAIEICEAEEKSILLQQVVAL